MTDLENQLAGVLRTIMDADVLFHWASEPGDDGRSIVGMLKDALAAYEKRKADESKACRHGYVSVGEDDDCARCCFEIEF